MRRQSVVLPIPRLRRRLKVGLRHLWKPTVSYALYTCYEANYKRLIQCFDLELRGETQRVPKSLP